MPAQDDQPDATAEGHYYRKQLGCKSEIIAWSHQARFRMGLRLLGPSVRRLLDYGSGDGTFLAMAAGSVREGWGADIALDQVEDCQRRSAALKHLRFCLTSALADPIHDAAYDAVTCMETLEHCVSPVGGEVLRDLARLVAPDGRVLISVPIETGPTFLFKLVIRKLAAWRGLSDYRYYESYPWRDMWRMIFATRRPNVERPVYVESGLTWHSHYGFNWRVLREQVREHFTVERTVFSPLGFTGGWLSSQAWFVCRPRA